MNNNDNNDDLDEENNKNRLNSTEAYIGYLIAFIFIGYTLFSTLTLSRDDSCENIIKYHNSIDDIENKYLNIQHKTVDTWNEFLDISTGEDYLYLTAKEQKELHKELEVYDFINDLNEIENLNITLQELILNIEDTHKDHKTIFNHSIDIKNFHVSRMQNYKDILNVYIEYIDEIEIYYEKWDVANEENNETLLFVTEDNFSEYDAVFTETLLNLYEVTDSATKNINQIYDEFYEYAYESCGIEFVNN